QLETKHTRRFDHVPIPIVVHLSDQTLEHLCWLICAMKIEPRSNRWDHQESSRPISYLQPPRYTLPTSLGKVWIERKIHSRDCKTRIVVMFPTRPRHLSLWQEDILSQIEHHLTKTGNNADRR